MDALEDIMNALDSPHTNVPEVIYYATILPTDRLGSSVEAVLMYMCAYVSMCVDVVT